MRLLIITQKVDRNDPVLGFFHRWLEEFAKHCKSLIIICLEKGEYSLPANAAVLSLGKEGGRSRFKYFINFYKYIWRERNSYDAVFVHMNPEYLALAGWWWKIAGKKTAFWYAHKSVDLKLRIAAMWADIIFTASEKSFRLASKKVQVVGHGIDTDLFKPAANRVTNNVFTIISAGRIAPVKNQLLLLESLARVKLSSSQPWRLLLIGAAATAKDAKYAGLIKEKIQNGRLAGRVVLVGPVVHEKLASYYQAADLVINLSATGSLDKDVLEAAACNVDILTSNEAYNGILPAQNLVNPEIDKIAAAISGRIESRLSVNLRPIVLTSHSLGRLITVIVKKLI